MSYEIAAHGNYQANWAHASSTTEEGSLSLAEDVLNKNWGAEIACITRINQPLIEINTGNKDWDNAFRLSQNLAYQLFLEPIRDIPAPSIVSIRKPDQGYSLLGDGSDYNHQWNGQTPFDSFYLVNFLLPTSPELLKGLLDNFLAVQTSQGEIASISAALGRIRWAVLMVTSLTISLSFSIFFIILSFRRNATTQLYKMKRFT